MAGFDNSYDKEDVDFNYQPSREEQVRFEVEQDRAWMEDTRERKRYAQEEVKRIPKRKGVDEMEDPRPRTLSTGEVEQSNEGSGAVDTVDSSSASNAAFNIFRMFRTDIRNNNWF